MVSYELSNLKYRKLINDPCISLKKLKGYISTPREVYRYRQFGHINDSKVWEESPFWKEDMSGICLFSNPGYFHKNDENDCRVNFDNNYVIEKIFSTIDSESIDKDLENYKKQLQNNMLVCCFTTSSPTEHSMWDTKYFGDNGKGFCVKYSVSEKDFSPLNVQFLPVLYDDEHYDNTPAVISYFNYLKNGCDNSSIDAERLACLGYGHTLIKPLKYCIEQEWRIIIPNRTDGKYDYYFDKSDGALKKKSFINSVDAIYFGPNSNALEKYKEYVDYAKSLKKNKNLKIYQMIETNKHLEAVIL